MDITALFDNADTAEHALVNLQALGICPSRYKIRALHISGCADGRGSTLPANAAGNPGFMSIGAVIPGFSDLPGGSGFSSGSGPRPREVQLLVTVEDSAAHRTQSALISNHARRVRMI